MSIFKGVSKAIAVIKPNIPVIGLFAGHTLMVGGVYLACRTMVDFARDLCEYCQAFQNWVVAVSHDIEANVETIKAMKEKN